MEWKNVKDQEQEIVISALINRAEKYKPLEIPILTDDFKLEDYEQFFIGLITEEEYENRLLEHRKAYESKEQEELRLTYEKLKTIFEPEKT